MSAFDCGFNRSMQHTEGCFGSRSVAYEVPDKDLLHPKTCKLARHRAVARQVAASLQQRWSPQQIAGWLKRIHPDDANGQVSHETIYRTLFIQARGAGRGGGRRRRRCSRASDHDLQLASSRTRCTRSSPSASQACSSTYHVPPTFRPGTLPLRSPHKGDFRRPALRREVLLDPGVRSQELHAEARPSNCGASGSSVTRRIRSGAHPAGMPVRGKTFVLLAEPDVRFLPREED
ncbi:hypothetical protein LA521A_00900 [Lysobacter auxotrophicus]|uniref:Transposase n=1 Tax=Lysobacter auxotrophicus TaxID=2992573 RepID=A0ABN6UEX7_9GAMM|nr:hypothetical protein LA521A_00900 [Lysobacter auxotrophicus]